MRGPVAEVDQFFGVAEGEAGAAAFVAGVRHRSGVVAAEGRGEIGLVDAAGPAAVAVAFEFAVPFFGGHPDFDFDVGVGGGL